MFLGIHELEQPAGCTTRLSDYEDTQDMSTLCVQGQEIHRLGCFGVQVTIVNFNIHKKIERERARIARRAWCEGFGLEHGSQATWKAHDENTKDEV